MGSVKEDGAHVHEPCRRCGVVEASEYGVCEECLRILEDNAHEQGVAAGREAVDAYFAEFEARIPR